MTLERERFLICMIFLLQQEVNALRSVLGEFEGDKTEFAAKVRADILRDCIGTMEFKL